MSLPIVAAITGASGAPYALRLLEILADTNHEVHLTISSSAAVVIKQETGLEVDLKNFDIGQLLPNLSEPVFDLHYHHYQDFFAPIASGSHLTQGMIICPCSGTTVSAIVHAGGQNLIQRAADVHLKERRKLVLVPRETPLSTIQLENLYRASQVGATVLPAMPGFYHGDLSFAGLVDFVVARILDQFQIEHTLMRRWGSESDHV